jgi:hypothetical protein
MLAAQIPPLKAATTGASSFKPVRMPKPQTAARLQPMQASTHNGASHSNVLVFAFIVSTSGYADLRQISRLDHPSCNYNIKAFLETPTAAERGKLNHRRLATRTAKRNGQRQPALGFPGDLFGGVFKASTFRGVVYDHSSTSPQSPTD